MKILLIGEYSNTHNTLAQGLRTLGHKVCVVSNGDFWKDYPRDIDVARTPGKLGGIRLMLKLWAILPKMRGYDVVQLINPMFFQLKAQRLSFFYNYLRKHNKRVVLGAFGMDWYWVYECTTNKPLRYSDFNFGDQLRTDAAALKEQKDWLGTEKERLNKMIANDCDAIVTGLYEYDVCYRPYFPEKTTFIPYPIVPASLSPILTTDTPIKIFIGISKQRSAYKGTDIMLAAAEEIVRKYSQQAVLIKAEGVPFQQYQHLMDNSDVLLDQLYAYTPAMNALLAMSKGIVVVGGGEEENYEILHEDTLRPIINVEPNYESVFKALEELVAHPEKMLLLKQQSVEYITKHHDYVKVAKRYEALYQQLLP